MKMVHFWMFIDNKSINFCRPPIPGLCRWTPLGPLCPQISYLIPPPANSSPGLRESRLNTEPDDTKLWGFVHYWKRFLRCPLAQTVRMLLHRALHLNFCAYNLIVKNSCNWNIFCFSIHAYVRALLQIDNTAHRSPSANRLFNHEAATSSSTV